jgi:predicted transposase YdaD
MGNADAIFHDLANQDPTGFARLVLGDPSVVAEGLPASLPIVRRRDGDALLVVHRGQEEDLLLHLECELRRRRAGPRLLEYAAILAKRERRARRAKGARPRPILSAVLILTGRGRVPRVMRHVVRGVDGPTIVFRYYAISVKGLRAEDLLASAHPALWALVSLARGGTRPRILKRAVTAVERADVSDEQRVALMTATWIFATIAGVHRMVERFTTMRFIREIPAIREMIDKASAKAAAKAAAKGEARGRAEGEAKARFETLAKVLGDRLGCLGSLPASLSRKIGAIKDPSELDRLVGIALEATSIDEFKAKAFPRRGR